MARTLTAVMPDLYEALDVVSRELVGLIPSVASSMTAERAAIGENIISPVAQQHALEDITPGVDPADSGDSNPGTQTLQITKAKAYPIRWSGEEQKIMNNNIGYRNYIRDEFEQGLRTLTNAVETDLATNYAAFSRAYGTAGTAPFATSGDMTDLTNVEKILADNGAGGSYSAVLNTRHAAALFGKNAGADFQGTDSFLRQGIMMDHLGMAVRRSGQLGASHTIGTGTGYLINGTPAVGDTTIPVDTGTGTIVAGDIITIAGDTNKYLVTTALSGGNVVIAAPGLLAAPANNAAVTVSSAFDYSMIFARNAVVLATRLPAAPAEGDSAVDVEVITDPRSGLSFEVRLYQQYRRIKYEIGLAWGWDVNKPEHGALLIG